MLLGDEAFGFERDHSFANGCEAGAEFSRQFALDDLFASLQPSLENRLSHLVRNPRPERRYGDLGEKLTLLH